MAGIINKIGETLHIGGHKEGEKKDHVKDEGHSKKDEHKEGGLMSKITGGDHKKEEHKEGGLMSKITGGDHKDKEHDGEKKKKKKKKEKKKDGHDGHDSSSSSDSD